MLAFSSASLMAAFRPWRGSDMSPCQVLADQHASAGLKSIDAEPDRCQSHWSTVEHSSQPLGGSAGPYEQLTVYR